MSRVPKKMKKGSNVRLNILLSCVLILTTWTPNLHYLKSMSVRVSQINFHLQLWVLNDKIKNCMIPWYLKTLSNYGFCFNYFDKYIVHQTRYLVSEPEEQRPLAPVCGVPQQDISQHSSNLLKSAIMSIELRSQTQQHRTLPCLILYNSQVRDTMELTFTVFFLW